VRGLQVRELLDSGTFTCGEREKERGQSGPSLLHACVSRPTEGDPLSDQRLQVSIGRPPTPVVRVFCGSISKLMPYVCVACGVVGLALSRLRSMSWVWIRRGGRPICDGSIRRAVR
jgi:hypothetical protein